MEKSAISGQNPQFGTGTKKGWYWYPVDRGKVVPVPIKVASVPIDECKTHLCFEFISHAILSILYPYSFKTHNISSKLGLVGILMENK